MKVIISKQAEKFIESINEPEKSKLISKIKLLVNSIIDKDLPELSQLNIKNLKGKWKGWQRLRIANIRVIFSVTSDKIIIEVINHRGNLY